ncbi:MAG: MFS transporter [Planctomycetales bacterium]|nr:MFS transporter [Planctomycetales bacterium]
MGSGYAGYLSDRYSKRRIVVASKMAEIVVMSLGVAGFLLYQNSGYLGLLWVLFLMGLQSTFFGPGKYGILPEMLREKDLPRANGLILMTTFLAIIFGTAVAGILKKHLMEEGQSLVDGAHHLWVGSAVCVLIAVAGTCTSLLIRRVPPAMPGLRFTASSVTVSNEVLRLLRRDRQLLYALLASCVFWLVSGVAIQAVNSFGLQQLQLGADRTSYLVAVIGLGIAIGAVVAGRLSHGRADFHVVRLGAWGIVLFLIPLAINVSGRHLLGFWGSMVLLALLGGAAGFFAIPLQVFIQSRPPAELKGRVIAVMNQANFLAILFAGVLYFLFDLIIIRNDWPRSAMFALMVLLMLPVLLFYHPNDVEP